MNNTASEGENLSEFERKRREEYTAGRRRLPENTLLWKQLDRDKKQYVIETVESAGSVSAAAKVLQVSKTTVYNYLKKIL